MRTALIILGGFVLLATCALVGRAVKGAPGLAQGSLLFIPLWFVLAAANMAIGVLRAGYSVAEEAPILLVIFAPPAAPVLLPRRIDRSIAQGFGFVVPARARGDTRCISSSRAGATEPKNKRAAGQYASGAALALFFWKKWGG